MAYHKNLGALFKAVQKDIHETMDKEVFDEVVEIQRESIIEEVYDAYEPFQYSRRGDNGGLSDADNNIASFFTVNGGVQMLIQNTTRGSNNGQYITPLIVGGDGSYGMEYDYKTNRVGTQDQYLRPRDFISDAIKRMKRSLEHQEALKKGLSNRGYRFYK